VTMHGFAVNLSRTCRLADRALRHCRSWRHQSCRSGAGGYGRDVGQGLAGAAAAITCR
jgi:hypothetical protein